MNLYYMQQTWMGWCFVIVACLMMQAHVEGVYEWSFQQRITLPTANSTYASTPSFLVGRGFITLVTGHSVDPPGIYIHTTDDGYLKHGQYVWSQQARLVAQGVTPADQFGKWLVAYNQTIIVSAPLAGDRRGFAYVFNGTLRHWSQIQRLIAIEGTPGDNFGEYMSLHDDRLIVSARGVMEGSGAVYVFERQPGGLYWSRQGRLQPRDLFPGHNFGDRVDLYGDTAVISARYDEETGSVSSNSKDNINRNLGSFYLFRGSGGAWSQQQKLVSFEMKNYREKQRNPTLIIQGLDMTLGYRYLGPNVAITRDQDVAVSITNLEEPKPNRESIWIFSTTAASRRWSLQQKLFWGNDTMEEQFRSTDVYTDRKNNIYASLLGLNRTSMYIFKTFGNGWSLQSKLLSYNETIDGLYYDNDESSTIGGTGTLRPPQTSFYHPRAWGGTLLTSAGNEIQIRNKYDNMSCLRIWMSDHFLDGWDTAVLTVRAPDLTNDTFHPHCDQIDPFYVRYCPYEPEDEGVYIVKVFAATQARFFWEISWQVEEEATGNIYRGDFATKMHFNFNATSSSFTLVGSENLIDLDAPCYRCTYVALRRWVQLQTIGDSAFWPLVVTGAPYYISDFQGRMVYATGKVCHGVTTYECYQRINDGLYILRLGGGLFGRITGFPYKNASWHGCGEEGTDRDQFIFRIADGICTPIQKYRYTWRCDRPHPINSNAYSRTRAPTSGGTQAPSQSVYGDPYVKGQMYAHKTGPNQVHASSISSNGEFVFQEESFHPTMLPASSGNDKGDSVGDVVASIFTKSNPDLSALLTTKEHGETSHADETNNDRSSLKEKKSDGYSNLQKKSDRRTLPQPILHFP